MGDKSEREGTTKYAVKKINSYLTAPKPDYKSALLLSAIYAEIRLRTLLTDWVSPPKDRRKETGKLFNLKFNGLINRCKHHKLLDGKERKTLDELRKKRNQLAHETALWKKLPTKEKKNIALLCKSTIQFLKRTTYPAP